MAALAQTWFVHTDFLEARADPGSVDCITALSVVKWIHLHRGDAGLKAFFSRIHSLLVPGGMFILEPQPWKSYRAAVGKMKRQGGCRGEGEEEGPVLQLPQHSFFHRVSELELRPQGFVDLLCGEFGFQLVKRLVPNETAEGFGRPLLVFRKTRQST